MDKKTQPAPSAKSRQNNSSGPGREKSLPGSNRHGKMMLFILLGLTFCIAAFLVILYPMVMTKADKEATLRIPVNATSEMVRDSLTRYFGKDYANTVMRIAGMLNTDFSKRNGAYTIKEGENPMSAARRITSGAQTPVRITINGFRSLPLLIERFSRKMEFPEDSLKAVLNDPDFMARYGLKPEQALALFIDDTYEVYWNTSARKAVEKIAENYEYLWNQSNVKAAADMGLTPADIMIIASITDEETNVNREKGIIGRLYINRLQNNMKLQADPTVRFSLDDFTIQRVTKEDLKVESPYNTYLHEGLPPGPIRTTSAETVTGILTSEPHGYLFMCAKEDFSGRHNFATTYDEHLRNATHYQAALDRKGIKR